MKDLLTGMIHDVKQSGYEMMLEQISTYENMYDEILLIAKAEYEKKPPNKYYRDGFNLYKRMEEYRDNPAVEYTNNISERGLRKYKRKQRQAVTFRSNHSVINLCDSFETMNSKVYWCYFYAFLLAGV